MRLGLGPQTATTRPTRVDFPLRPLGVLAAVAFLLFLTVASVLLLEIGQM